MALLYFILCALRPVCLPLPEMSIVLWGNIRFGSDMAFAIGYIGSLVGINGMYLLSERLLSHIKRPDKINKYINMAKSHKYLITGLLYILPILPDMVVSIGASLLDFKFRHFLALSMIFKAISIGLVAYSDEIARHFNVSQSQIILLETVVLCSCSLLYKIFDKRRGSSNEEDPKHT